ARPSSAYNERVTEIPPYPPHTRRTKIVCTIGPATASPEGVASLISAGMNVARLNTSHGAVADHAAMVSIVRDAAQAAGRQIAILMDLGGPKPRTQPVSDVAAQLTTGSHVLLAPQPCENCDL